MHSLTTPALEVYPLGTRATRSDVSAITAWIHDALEKGARLLVVDLSNAAYVDSNVLASLVDGVRVAEARGGDLVLAGPRTSVRVILELTRLHTVFDVFESVDAAARLTPVQVAA